VNSHFG